MQKMIRRGVIRRRGAVLLGAGMLACPIVVRGSAFTWDGGDASQGYFSAGDNWVGNVAPPTGGADLIFGSTNTQSSAPFADSPYSLNSLTFNSSAYSYAGSRNLEAHALTIGTGGISDQAAANEAISNAVVLSASQTWNISAGQLLLSNDTLTNSSSSTLTRTGSGTLNLALSGTSGISALALQGGTTQITSGTLTLNQTVNGTLKMTSGSTLNLSGGAVVNSSANGLVSVIIDSASTVNVNGAQLNALGGSAEIDAGRNGNGVLNVSNSGSISSASYLTVGLFSGGNGTLTMSSGATASAPYAIIGGSSGATGTVKVAASTLNVTTNLEMSGNTISGNYGGTSTLTISNSGTVNAAVTSFYSNSSTINVSGGTLSTAGLNSNASGNGAILLTDPSSGFALNLTGTSGTYAYSGSISGTGTLNKSGGSTQTLSGLLACGQVQVNSGTLNLALSNSNANTLSTLSLNGGTTQLSSGTLTCGSASGGIALSGATFNVTGGAIVNNNASPKVISIAGNSSVLVSGMGSRLDDSGGYAEIDLGAPSTGNLTISTGGVVSAVDIYVGSNAGGTGNLVANGSGSTLTAGGILDIGAVGSTGNVTLLSGSVANVAFIRFESINSNVNVSGGTLNTGYLTSNGTGHGAIILNNSAGAYALNINDPSTDDSNTFSGIISGTGSLNKSGGSTQTLSGNNTFTGPVLVTGGTLVLGGTNKFTFANVSGGTLSMGTSGALAAGTNVTVAAGATFTPGSSFGNGGVSIGTVTLNGGTLSDSATGNEFELSQIVTGSTGGTVDFTGSASSFFVLTGGGSVIIINGNSTWLSPNNSAQILGGGTINISSGVTLTNGIALGLDSNFNLIGGGTLYQNSDPHNAGFMAASITVTQGQFRLTDASSNLGQNGNEGNFGVGTFTLNGGTLSYGGITATTIKPINITASGGTVQIESATATLTDSGGIISSGSLLKTGPGELIVPAFSATNLTINNGTLGLSGSGGLLKVSSTLTVGAFTTLDLGANAADIGSGNLVAINLLVQQGYNAGRWNGSGITSTTAAADTKHLTAIGIIQNNQGGSAIYNSSHQFLSTTPGTSDILAAYTYYGDTNLDGKVDGSDYSRIDAAYLADKTNPTAATGWFNGDFNYDGVINGSDYTLIDNAFNTQGALLAANLASPTAVATDQIATTAAVPEPTSLAFLAIAATGILSRRKTVAESDNARCFRRHI